MSGRRLAAEVSLYMFCYAVYTYTFHMYILWVPYYMHLLQQYFDYLLCDGSHGFSKYGWKFVPICILTSGGWTVPIGSVFGLEEDSESLNALIELFRVHCQRHGVACHHFNLRDKSDLGTSVHLYSFSFFADFEFFEFGLSVHCGRCTPW